MNMLQNKYTAKIRQALTLSVCAAVAVLFAACSTITQPLDPQVPSDLTSYFWPDSTGTFNYFDGSSTFGVKLTVGGAQPPIDLSTGNRINLNTSGGTVALSWSDSVKFFPMPAGSYFGGTGGPGGTTTVTDSLTTLLALTDVPFMSGRDKPLYFDSLLIGKILPIERAVQPTNIAALSGITIFAIPVLYAGTKTNEFWNFSKGKWTQRPGQIGTGGINQIAISPRHLIAFLIVGGLDVYAVDLTSSSTPPAKIYSSTGDPLVALDLGESDMGGTNSAELFIATKGGTVVDFDISSGTLGTPHSMNWTSGVPANVRSFGIFTHSGGSQDNGDFIVATDQGLFSGKWDSQKSQWDVDKQAIVPEAINILQQVPLFNNKSMFYAGADNGNVYSVKQGGGPGKFPATAVGHAAGGPIQTFSVDEADPVNTVKALVKGSLYSINQTGAWALIPNPSSTITIPRSFGDFVVLKQGAKLNDTWIAGTLVLTPDTNPQSFPLTARVLAVAPEIVLDSVRRKDVIIIRYAFETTGGFDNSICPEYLIYFQRGKGPVKIEETIGTKTISVRLMP